jgi:ABC-type branched-subunit amino acid transport system ATPase component
MKLFGFTKLSAKLLALYLVLIGVTLVGLFSALETRDYFAQRRSLVVNLQELIKTQSVPIATALWELDTKKINTFLEEVEKLQFVRGAVITDSTGKIVAKIGDIDTPPKSADFVAQEPLVFRSGANPQTIGSIKIIVHDQEILRTVKNRLVNDAIILLVLLAVLTGATIFATNVIVGRPLTLLKASIEKIRQDGVRERVDWALEFAGLVERRHSRVKTFSGGMQRRLNLAAALVHDPQIFLLDEPTVGVDPQSRNHIFESIEQLKKEGRTIIYTTHYMEEAQRL